MNRPKISYTFDKKVLISVSCGVFCYNNNKIYEIYCICKKKKSFNVLCTSNGKTTLSAFCY